MSKMKCVRIGLLSYLLGLFFVLSPICYSVGYSVDRYAREASDYDQRAEKILQETPLVDG